jgi:hypothetical protein
MRAAWTSLILALSLAIASTSPVVAARSESGTSPVFTIGPGHSFIAFVPGASSTLVRTDNGISVSLTTSGLPDGHAVTVWALIFNDPTACEGGVCDETRGDLNIPEVQGSVFRVTGHVVSTSSSFGGHIAVGDAANAARGPGLLDPYGAQIHLIVREHGMAGTGELLQQQFNNDSPRFCNVACADIQKSIHLAHQ